MSVFKTEQFRNLHSNNAPLFLINIWDAASASIVQASGSTALATSSASLAWANGYADGNALPRAVLLRAIDSIVRISKVPLTVDIENGYSDSPDDVAELVLQLAELGVAGVNIEDGCDSAELLVKKISAIRSQLGMDSIFINARTDVYLQDLVAQEKQLNESIERLNKYIACGADGVFVPAMTSASEIASVSSMVAAPLNIMAPGGSGNLEELINAGAHRISLGPTPFIDAYSTLLKTSTSLQKTTSRNHALTYDALNEMF